MQFEATRQGSGTVQDLLNSLEKLAVRIVQYPDGYTMRKQFLAALCEPLCREVLLQGHTAEFSRGAELTLAAERVENAMRYDVSCRHTASRSLEQQHGCSGKANTREGTDEYDGTAISKPRDTTERRGGL